MLGQLARSLVPMAAIGAFLTLNTPIVASATDGSREPTQTQQQLDEIGPIEAVIVAHLPTETMFFEDATDATGAGRVTYDVYEGQSLGDLLTSLSSEDGEVDVVPVTPLVPSEVASTLVDALEAVRSRGLETTWVHFVSKGALNGASRPDLSQLGSLIRRKEVIASVYGSPGLLRERLRLPIVPGARPHRHDGRLHVVRMNKTEGHLEQLALEIPAASFESARFAEAFLELDEWLFERRQNEILSVAALHDGEQDPPPPPAAWKAIINQWFQGTLENIRVAWSETTQTSGNWAVNLKVWYLSGQKGDWYLIQITPLSSNISYKNKGFVCGWWTATLDAAVSFENGAYDDFMPDGTINNTTQTFTIGGGITPKGPSGNVSISNSYGTQDLEITADADVLQRKNIFWQASLRGCRENAFFGFFTGASHIATNSYKYSPEATVLVTNGRPLVFSLTAVVDKFPGVTQFTGVQNEEQHKVEGTKFPVSLCDRVQNGSATCVMEPGAHATDADTRFICNHTSCQIQ